MRWDVLSYSDMFNSATPWTVACQAPLSMAILQARTLEWVAVPSSRSSQPRDQTQVSCITGRFFTMWSTREALKKKDSFLNMIFLQVSHPFLLCWVLWVYSCSPWSALTFILRAEALSAHEPQARTGWICMDVGISGPVLSGFWQMDCSSVLREAVSCFWLFLFLLI